MIHIGKMLPALLALTFAAAGPAPAADDADLLLELEPAGETDAGGSGIRFGGYAEFAGAYTYADPEHWSKLRGRIELGASGASAGGIKWKLSGRADGDAAYHVEDDYYPARVREDQRREFMIREAYLDASAGDWEFRLGRQHVVWGEMVGLFFADVVSARDLREFFLPEFEAMRIPQWALRAEHFGGDSYFELLWIPVPSYDEVGKPGADFFPYALPEGSRVREKRPGHGLGETNWGLRASRLVGGWDLSAFYYRSNDVSPTPYLVDPDPLRPRFELRHDRIAQVGGTFSKDLGQMVLKGEAVHTRGRRFPTSEPGAPFGLKSSRTIDYVLGLDVPVEDTWRFNVQYFGRYYGSHDAAMGIDRHETGVTLLVNRKFGDRFEAEVLLVSSLNRSDYMLRPKLVWHISPEWRGQLGADVFGGHSRGVSGRFDERDRVYVEVRRWF